MTTELDEARAKLTCLGISLKEIGTQWFIDEFNDGFRFEVTVAERKAHRGSELAFAKLILANIRSKQDEDT